MAADPRELARLRARLAELEGIRGSVRVLSWDKSTYMPPGAAEARGEQMAVLERIAHDKLVDPEVGDLLDALASWADGEDPDGDDARALVAVRRDHERALRVPGELAAEMARAGAVGEQAWLEAYTRSDFSRFRDALALQIELARRYAACFADAEHPYDPLLDSYEPEFTHAQLRPVLESLTERLAPLVRAADGLPGTFEGTHPIPAQRAAILDILGRIGFDARTWRMDDAPHPFCLSPGPGDYRITTRYRENDFGIAFYSALHEFGHGLYEEGVDPRLAHGPLHSPVSLGIHESQSRLWENIVGRSLPFLEWALPQLSRHLGGFADVEARSLYRSVNGVAPSLIRVDSDETTYNLHIVLRFELEVALLEGRLEASDVPAAWAEQADRLLGLEVPDDARGALQDVHWSIGAIGYFPTYALGNLISAQLWAAARAALPSLDDDLARGTFGPLREWLREHVHRHGRKYPARELLRRATGQELSAEPFLAYLEAKLSDAGVLAGRPAAS